MGADGRKMSKSLGNMVSSNDVVERNGADACRMTILFLGPFGANVTWSEETLTGVARFLKRVENFYDNLTDDALDSEQERLVNQLAKDVGERIENMQFNTAISAMMEFINAFAGKMPRIAYEVLIQVLNPFAPHLTEEMWNRLGHKDMLVFETWPKYDESKLGKKTAVIVASVNGKRRGDFEVSIDAPESEIIETAKSVAEKFLTGEIVKKIVLPGKMVNFVIK